MTLWKRAVLRCGLSWGQEMVHLPGTLHTSCFQVETRFTTSLEATSSCSPNGIHSFLMAWLALARFSTVSRQDPKVGSSNVTS